MLELTLGVLDLLQTLSESRAILKFQAFLIRSDSLVVSPFTVQSSTFPRVSFRPRRVYFNALCEAGNKSLVNET